MIRPICLALIILVSSLAEANSTNGRSKVIDFENEVIEGVNKRPLDSLSQVSEKDKRKRKNHLYRIRGGFRSETQETLRELRAAP